MPLTSRSDSSVGSLDTNSFCSNCTTTYGRACDDETFRLRACMSLTWIWPLEGPEVGVWWGLFFGAGGCMMWKSGAWIERPVVAAAKLGVAGGLRPGIRGVRSADMSGTVIDGARRWRLVTDASKGFRSTLFTGFGVVWSEGADQNLSIMKGIKELLLEDCAGYQSYIVVITPPLLLPPTISPPGYPGPSEAQIHSSQSAAPETCLSPSSAGPDRLAKSERIQ